MQEKFIYLDNNATTPIDPRVLEAMMPYLTDLYGNASSSHKMGKQIGTAVQKARTQVGDLLDVNAEDIYFTSGATEAINIVLQGIPARDRLCKHIITVETEHPAVLDTCQYLETIGVEVSYLPVAVDGGIDFQLYNSSFKENTVLVCIMTANNESGRLQDINQLAQVAREKDVLFMTDATQAIGKIPFSAEGIDIVAMSAHKFYGPKSVGAIYINPYIKLSPLIYGGGHERGLRSGTLGVANIIGMGKAAELVSGELEEDSQRISDLRGMLRELLESQVDGATALISSEVNQIPNTLNIRFEGINNDALVLGLKDICISNGSACHSFVMEPSHVLLAMGLSKEEANESVRFSLGRFNTEKEIKQTVEAVKNLVTRLRAMAF
jgi:cysteine desulfurase